MSDVTLPYRTDWRDMLNVLDYAKGSGADRASLDARFGAGEAMRETLNALDQLDLALRDDSGGVRLTALGDRLAYAASESERRDVLIEALLGYHPYRVPLERAVAEAIQTMEAPWVEHVWQVDMRLGQPRNRVEEARTFFFRVADAAGLGDYRRGVRGQATRLELAGDFSETIQRISGEIAPAPGEAGRPVESDVAPAGWSASPMPSPAEYAGASPVETGAGLLAAPSLTMTVDFTDWDIDRIREFLQLVGYPITEPAESDAPENGSG